MPRSRRLLLALSFGLLLARPARADETSTTQAREEFLRGAAFVADARWAEALEHFERANELRPHAITLYNVATCHRALGAYTRARRSYAAALRASADASADDRLTESVRKEIEGLLAQLESAIARLEVILEPTPSRVGLDGRPLLFEREDVAIAGARAPGPAEPVLQRRFVVELDPGVHTIDVQRDGYASAIATRTTAAGTRSEIAFHLDRLPSTLRVASTPSQSVVRIDGIDVGTSPITVTRPPGPHHVVILQPGFVTYDAHVSTHPGEDLRITGNLAREKVPLSRRWWFWAGLGAAVLAAGVTSYAIVRSTDEPEQAPFDGGTLGWTVPAP